MTSISAASAQTYQSPLQKLQDELLSEVKSGAIKSSDQDALASALTDIDSAMQASRASDQASGTRPSPADLKSKIDDLIAGEVSSGKLTSDQATELQGIFKAAFANGPGGAGGPGGPGGAGGPPPGGPGGPPPADGASSSDDTSSSTTSTSIDDILKQFLQSLQESLSASSSTTYGATGSSSTQQRFLLGVADRLSKLSPGNAFSREADKATQQPSFPKGKDGCLIFGSRNRAAIFTLVPLQDVWRGPMASDVMTKPHQLIASDRVEGTAVRRPNGDMIGHIERLMIDKVTGKVSYAILSFGGFLGIGANLIPLPWGRLRYNTKFEAYELDIDDEELKRAPSFQADKDFDWGDRAKEAELHRYYGMPPYWSGF